MISRSIAGPIARYSREFPALVILGARQVGKTTLVKLVFGLSGRKYHYLDLERSTDYAVLERDAETYLSALKNECVVIDEIQRMPSLFPLLRALIDQKRRACRFILTGSASPALLKDASESLAGRVHYFYLNPIGLHELPAGIAVRRHWFRGGFPKVLTMRSLQVMNGWLDSFITTYIERDLPMLFDVRMSPQLLRRLWGMLAHLNGELLSYDKIAASLGAGGTTVRRYLDYIEGAFLIRRLPPWFANVGKRLVKAPKIYFTDTGILHFLLRIGTERELLSHPTAGNSWECYCINQIMFAAPSRLDAYFYRTHQGSECDLVLVKGHIVVGCVEIKMAAAPVLQKGFYQAIADLKCKKKFVVCNTRTEYKNRDGIVITNIDTFVRKHLPKL